MARQAGNYLKTKSGVLYAGQTNHLVARYPGAERSTVLVFLPESDPVQRDRQEFYMIAELVETETASQPCANIARTHRIRK